jgi:drug/metabolite transporter (DMT)-like permease
MLAAILGWIAVGERPSALTWIAVAASVVGIAIMVSDSYAQGTALGDAIAAMIALGYAVAIVTMRRHREIEMLPAMCLAVLAALAIAAALAPTLAVSARASLLLVLFGAVQLGLGLALFSIGVRLIPTAQTALIGNLEPILGPLWVWALLNERPGTLALVGGAIVMTAVFIHAGLGLRRAQA